MNSSQIKGEQGGRATVIRAVRAFWVWRFLPLIVVAALGASLLGSTLLRDWHWEHHPLHAFIEGMGAFCAFMLVGLFSILRGYGRLAPDFVWVLCALVAMGVLDAFHAATHAGSLFVWLHSIATLLGGILFAFVWLPATVANGPLAYVLARATFPAVTSLGLVSVAYPAALPTMLDENGFSLFAKAINILGGVGFLAAAWRFAVRSAAEGQGSAASAVFANHCLIFGIAAFLFVESALWDFSWWLWHVLRLLAYAIPLFYFFDLYRASQEQLRASEERLRTVIQNMPVILDAMDEEGNIIVWNREAERATGYSAEEIVGNRQAWVLLYPDRAYRESMFAEWKRRGDHRAWDWRVRAKDGSERLIEWSNISHVFPIPGWSSWGIGVDVTERTRAEHDLRESEQRFRTIFEQAAVGVALIESRTGRFLRINQRYCSIVGYTAEEMSAGKTFQEITHPDDLQPDLDNMARLLAGEIREFTMEKRYCHKNGSIVWVNLTVSPTWRPGEEPTNHIAVVEDITERRHAEEQVRERDAQLAHMDRLSTLGELATSIAHELNQPLAAIVCYAEGIAWRVKSRDRYDDDLLDAVEQIGAMSRRASDIIRGLRSLVRKDEGQVEPLQLNEVVYETLRLLQPQARKKGITLHVELDRGLPNVRGNDVQLKQVVLNLARNSIDALEQSTAKERTMILKTSVNASNEVVLAVIDNGIGLSPDESADIFDAFVSTKPDGMGLGLSISRTIINAHRGRIWAMANRPHGAIVHVTLPVEEAPMDWS